MTIRTTDDPYDDRYDAPLEPEIRLDTLMRTAAENARLMLDQLIERVLCRGGVANTDHDVLPPLALTGHKSLRLRRGQSLSQSGGKPAFRTTRLLNLLDGLSVESHSR